MEPLPEKGSVHTYMSGSFVHSILSCFYLTVVMGSFQPLQFMKFYEILTNQAPKGEIQDLFL